MDTIGSDQEKTSAVKQPAESAASGPAIPLGQDGDSQFSTPHAPSPEMNPAGETTASARTLPPQPNRRTPVLTAQIPRPRKQPEKKQFQGIPLKLLPAAGRKTLTAPGKSSSTRTPRSTTRLSACSEE